MCVNLQLKTVRIPNSCYFFYPQTSQTVFRSMLFSNSAGVMIACMHLLVTFFLSVSYSPSGCICIWDLGSSLMNGGSAAAAAAGARQQLHPLVQIMGQSEPCRALAWCPHDSNYLITGKKKQCNYDVAFERMNFFYSLHFSFCSLSVYARRLQ